LSSIMIRARFLVNPDDYRPVSWPIKHPYWCTGLQIAGGEVVSAVIVAYADDEAEILRLWPDAREIDSRETNVYVFTRRFPKPTRFDDDSPGGESAA